MIRPRERFWPFTTVNPLPLFTNHMDAWGVTAVIVTCALSVHQRLDERGLLLLALLTATYWFGFALNDYFDVPVDRLDPHKAKRNFFVRYAARRRVTALVAVLVSVLLLFGYAQFGVRGLWIFLAGFPVAWAYSAPPLRLKSIPFLDLAAHALFVQTFPYLVTLVLLDVAWLPLDYLVIVTFVLTSLSSQFEQQVRDYVADSQLEQNFTTRFGPSRSQALIRALSLLVFVLFSAGFALQIIPLLYLPLALITLPLLIDRFLHPEQPRPRWLVVLLTVLGLAYAGLIVMLHVAE